MTKDELKDLIYSGEHLDEIIQKLQKENAPIVSYEGLKDLVIEHVENEEFLATVNVLAALNANQADWYIYDVSMGARDNPRPISRAEDLYELCDW